MSTQTRPDQATADPTTTVSPPGEGRQPGLPEGLAMVEGAGVEGFELVDGVLCPVDPQSELDCEACQ